MLAFVPTSRLSDAPHGLGSPERRDDRRAPIVPESLGLPLGPAPQRLHAL